METKTGEKNSLSEFDRLHCYSGEKWIDKIEHAVEPVVMEFPQGNMKKLRIMKVSRSGSTRNIRARRGWQLFVQKRHLQGHYGKYGPNTPNTGSDQVNHELSWYKSSGSGRFLSIEVSFRAFKGASMKIS
ncbi:MAG: hypothetical protein KJ804_20515 [Proteobacteria bacterium]|nr:hypothetical protein [Pseudomonadota bacterium]